MPRLGCGRPAADLDQLLDAAEVAEWIAPGTRTHIEVHWLKKYWPKADAEEVLPRGLYWAMRVAGSEDGNLCASLRPAGRPGPAADLLRVGVLRGKPRARSRASR